MQNSILLYRIYDVAEEMLPASLTK